ncbi:hypothetical protein ABK040_013768 [Willaertia magna]
MNDRIRDLKRRAGDNVQDVSDIELRDLETGEGGYANGKLIPEDSEFVSSFFEQVSEIKTAIAKIDTNATKINKTFESLRAIPKTGNNKKYLDLKQQYDSLIEETEEELKTVKPQLEKMGRDIKKLPENCAERRMRENQQSTLTQEFFTVVQRFNGIQAACKSTYEEDLKRNLSYMYEEDEVEQIMESGVDMDTIYSKFLLKKSTDNTVKAKYQEIKETHEDLKKLEMSMNELQDMFRDLHTLIMMQQDLIDNIEDNVLRSVDYVEKGVKNLKTAKKLADKGRSMKCILLVCFIIILIVVALIAAGVIAIVLPIQLTKK